METHTGCGTLVKYRGRNFRYLFVRNDEKERLREPVVYVGTRRNFCTVIFNPWKIRVVANKTDEYGKWGIFYFDPLFNYPPRRFQSLPIARHLYGRSAIIVATSVALSLGSRAQLGERVRR